MLFFLIEEGDNFGSYQVVVVSEGHVEVLYSVDAEVGIMALPGGKVRVVDMNSNVATESDPRTWPKNHAGAPTFEITEEGAVVASVSLYATREEVLNAANLTEDDLDEEDDDWGDEEDDEDDDDDDLDDDEDGDDDDLEDDDWEDEDEFDN